MQSLAEEQLLQQTTLTCTFDALARRMRFRPAVVDKRLMEMLRKKYKKPVNRIFNDPNHTMPPQKSLEDRKNEKLLFDVLKQLPNWGVGRLLLFKQDLTNFNDDPTYWKITRVLVDLDDHNMSYGVAWGIFTWKGWCEEYEKEIPRVNRHGWRLIPKLDEHLFTNYTPRSRTTVEVPMYFRPPPLLSAMYKAEQLKKGQVGDMEPAIRLLLDRNRDCVERQRLDDGTMV